MAKKPAIMVAIVLSAAAILGLCSAPTYADINPIERFNQYSITFDNSNNFANAKEPDAITQTWQATALNDSTTAFFNTGTLLPPPPTWVGDGVIGVSSFVNNPNPPPPALPYVSAIITADNGLTGTTTLSGVFPVTVGHTGGLYSIEGKYGSHGGVDDNGKYIFQMVLPGNWSTACTTPTSGEHQLVHINPLWTIDTDWSFVGGYTTFSAHIDPYFNDPPPGTHRYDIGLDFIIYGAPVPVPPSMLLLGSGLLGLAGWRRFRKS